jgi:hypothetical protein
MSILRLWSMTSSLLLFSAACTASSPQAKKPGAPTARAKSKSTARSDAGASSAGSDAASGGQGSRTDAATGSSSARTTDAGKSQMKPVDAGTNGSGGTGGSQASTMDAGAGQGGASDSGTPPAQDAASDAGTDAAPLMGVGSCCAEHTTPGCSNADLQVCVCEKLSSCCTDAWGATCVMLVKQKFCQPGVRDCVCGGDAGQAGQSMCCLVEWSEGFCNDVAKSQCGALPGCI